MAQPTNGVDLNQQAQQQQQQWIERQQYQQQWIAAMQYPAAAMAMMHQHHMMMYPPHHQHYIPFSNPHYQSKQHYQQNQRQGSNDESKTIWIGDLHHWMDENYLHSCFAHTGEVFSIKVIRNKQTGQSEGYGFVEFYSRATAENVLQNYNGAMMPNTEQPFRLNWATFSSSDRRSEVGSDLSIFVGDLASDVTDVILQETFSSKYPSVNGAKVVIDSNTGRSKGYGFVRFGDENERSRAMTEMNGIYCSDRPMRVDVATPKKPSGNQQHYSSQAVVLAGGNTSNGAMAQGSQPNGGSNNTTIFVGGLDSDVGDGDLRQPFSQFGEIVSVKIPAGKGCGFVQFATRKSAEDAIEGLNGTVIGKQTVRLSWGRSPANKQLRSYPGNQWNGARYGGQGYDGYGYAAVNNQDASMHDAAAVNGDS